MSNCNWSNVNKSAPCLICGKRDWCSFSKDGKLIICKRINNGTAIIKKNNLGEEYYLYNTSISDISKLRNLTRPFILAKKTIKRNNSETLDKVYSSFLSKLSLSEKHLSDLKTRGISIDEISKRNYKSIPKTGRARLVRSLLESFSIEQILTTPGFYLKKNYISFSGNDGLAIPCRDVNGRIFAIKIRPDGEHQEGGKYRYFSSASHNGPSAIASTHCPLKTNQDFSTVIITEGELKADICCYKNLPYTLAIPGVNNLTGLLDSLISIRPTKVNIAFDNDLHTNQNVKKAFIRIYQLLNNNGFKVGVLSWK